MPDIHKTGLAVIRAGRILLCRKRGPMRQLILPGGKYEAGEAAHECLAREVQEELGVQPKGARLLAAYEDWAAGDETRRVRVDLFLGELSAEPAPRAEIEELVWFGPGAGESELSPSLRNQILPDLRRRGLL